MFLSNKGLLLMAASVSTRNFVLSIINYTFDFLLECWYFFAISVVYR